MADRQEAGCRGAACRANAEAHLVRARQAAPLQLLAALLLATACATGPGDELPCPECDPEHEILVGTRCVHIEDAPRCGPLGHWHEEEEACECEDGRAPVEIEGEMLCLQSGCIYGEGTGTLPDDGHGH